MVMVFSCPTESRLLPVGRLVLEFGFLSYKGLGIILRNQTLGGRSVLDKVKLHWGACGVRAGVALQLDAL